MRSSAFVLFVGLLCEHLSSSPYMVLLLWDKANSGMGHISLEVYKDTIQLNPSYYLSFAMENKPTEDLIRYGEVKKILLMPSVDEHNWTKFVSWYENSLYFATNSPNYKKSYNTLTNNCAHLAFNAMREFGYDISLIKPLKALPKMVFKSAMRFSEQQSKNL